MDREYTVPPEGKRNLFESIPQGFRTLPLACMHPSSSLVQNQERHTRKAKHRYGVLTILKNFGSRKGAIPRVDWSLVVTDALQS